MNRLFERGEGNPLYTEELLAAGTDGRGAAPQSLRDAFIARIEQLSADAQRIARVVSVGRVLDERQLVEVTGLSVDAIQVALHEAVAEHVLIACDDTGFGFRHALLREALHDDLLPGERSELHLALAHQLEHDCGIDDEQELERRTAIAGHYAAAGDQPAALRSTIAAAVAAQRVFAFGEAADLADRALELWPRVADPERVAEVDHVDLLRIGSRAHGDAGNRPRAESLLREALRELGPSTDPALYAYLLARACRERSGCSTRAPRRSRRPSGRWRSCPPTRPRAYRPLILAWLARMRFLRGNFQDAITDAERALEAAVAAGDRLAESELLNTLGMATLADPAARRGGRAAAPCDRDRLRGRGLRPDRDRVHEPRRHARGAWPQPRGAGGDAHECMQRLPRRYARRADWVALTIAEQAFDVGDWPMSREHLERASARTCGTVAIFRALREAELALGVGDEDLTERLLDDLADGIARASEPQWIGGYGALRVELHIRRGELDDARRYAEEGLGRIELCTDDVIRIARLSAAAVAAEAERAQRARDLHDTAGRRDALARARIHMDRLQAAVESGGAVEQARLTQAKAEMAIARGRGSAREWQRAVAAWHAIDRPYRAAQARWHQAQCEVAAGNRDDAAETAAAALTEAERLGSGWLAGEVRALIGASAARVRRARSRAEQRRQWCRRVRRPVRADPARAPGAGAGRAGGDQPPDRPGAVHGREDGVGACQPDPLQARRPGPHRGGRSGAPTAPDLSRGVACGGVRRRIDCRADDTHTGRVGTARAHDHGLAVPRRAVGRHATRRRAPTTRRSPTRSRRSSR